MEEGSFWDRIKVGKKVFKNSLIAGISLVTFGTTLVMVQDNVKADTIVNTSDQQNATATTESKDELLESSNSDVASSDSATSTSDVSVSSAMASNAVGTDVASTSTQKAAKASVTNNQTTTRVPQANVASASDNNQGNLDSATISDDSLNVNGWHATNYADVRNNNFVIVYDVTQGHEIARQQIQANSRQDVANVHSNLTDAANSGFKASFDLSDAMVGDQIQIISRYSASLDGNSDYVDYWFAPIIFNKNYANLDSANISETGQLTVSGWHAADESLNKDNHYLILFDNTIGKQLALVLVSNSKRTDIKSVYPGIYNEDNSGFSGSFDLGNVDLSHDISLVSRYSNSISGNGGSGSYVDYWFNLAKYDSGNEANLETFSFDGNNVIHASGWNATNLSLGKENHFIILFDSTTGKQIASQLVNSSTRTDVAKAYTKIINADQSGFSTDFAFNSSLVGHNLQIVSRYSNSKNGNGGTGNYVDYWFNTKSFNQSAYSVDHFSVKGNESIHVDGWVVSDKSVDKDNTFIIVLNKTTGKEVARQSINLTTRNDVGNKYMDVYNSRNSGFSINIPITAGMSGENLQFVLRFSSSTSGNSDYSDVYTGTYSMPNENKGSFDSIKIGSNYQTISISGWHAADGSYLKQYSYFIVVDSAGKELGRTQVQNVNQARNDVYNAYPGLYDAGQSGFSGSITLNNSISNKYVKIIHRYTDDVNGNGDYVDLYSAIIPVNITINVQANAINAYIVNNHLQHAQIKTQIWSGYPTDDMNYATGAPQGVVIHETATYNDSIQGEMNYAMNHYENAFVHSYVSDSQIINVANTDLKCWGSGAQGNTRFVQFEQIEVHSKSAFAYEINNAAYYTAYLLREYDLTPELCVSGNGTVWSHHDVSTYLGGTDHTDPDGYWATNASQLFGTSYTMNDFFELVKNYFVKL